MKVLVDKCSTLGDGLCYLPALAALAASPRITAITVVTTPLSAPLFTGLSEKITVVQVPYADTLHAGLWRGLRQVWPRLRRERFDAAVHNHHSQTFAFLLAWLLRIPTRIGFDFPLARGYRLATRRLPLPVDRNVIELNLDPVRTLLGQPELRPQRTPPPIRAGDRAAVEHRLRALGLDQQPFVLMHRGARHAYRQWPYFDELPTAVEQLIGLPMVEAVEQAGPSPVRQIAGLSLGEFAALMEKAAAFVGNNSGPMHLAGALGIPSVILQGASARNWEFYWTEVPHRTLRVEHLPCAPCERLDYYPPACANRDHPMACLRRLSVEQVVSALQFVLSGRKLSA